MSKPRIVKCVAGWKCECAHYRSFGVTPAVAYGNWWQAAYGQRR